MIKMELFVLIILTVFVGFIGICVCIDRYDINRNIKKKCIGNGGLKKAGIYSTFFN